MIKRKVIVVLLFLFAYAELAFAQDLNNGHVNKFINAMEIVKTTDDPSINALKKQSKFSLQQEFPVDKKGRLSIFRDVLGKTSNNDEKKSLIKVAKESAFSSVDEWAEISDRVMAAYIKISIDKQGGGSIPELTPAIRQSLPPEMLTMIERLTMMLDAVKNSPVKDVNVVNANYVRIEKTLQNN